MALLTQLLDAGVHFGHQPRYWNPKMFPYIYTEKNGMHVIDLVQTAKLLIEADNYVQEASKEGKQFLFIGRKRQAAAIIAKEAEKCSCPYVNGRWLGGTLTNWSTVQRRVRYLRELNEKEESGELDLLPKKEATLLRRKRKKLLENLGGLTKMSKIPDIAIVVDPKHEAAAVSECRKLGVTIISILDTNCDPSVIDIPIPANAGATRSIEFIISILCEAILQGRPSKDLLKI
jgi:small subunit ribosomal protein S2